jgi:osmotically inducible lipoprotein OsmB
MHARLGFSVMALGLLLSACGSTTSDRAVSGAGIGAVAGVVGGALIGAPAIGAAVGAAAGGTIGAVTTPSDVDLGKPVWK